MIALDSILPTRLGTEEYQNLRVWADSDHHQYSEHTERTWRYHLKHFYEYCEERNLNWFPASTTTVLDYLRDHQYGWKPSTQALSMSVLNVFHRRAGVRSAFDDEDVKLVIRELNDAVRIREVPRLTGAQLIDITSRLGESVNDKWAKAIIWFTYDTRYRSTALVEVTLEDIQFENDGTASVAPPRRTDIWTFREGRLARTTAALVQDWLIQAGISAGPIFPRVSPKGRIRFERVTQLHLRKTLIEALRVAAIDTRGINLRSIRSGSIKDMENFEVGMFRSKIRGGYASLGMIREYTKHIPDSSALQLAALQNR